jgi:para-nitrobenzyl esterase
MLKLVITLPIRGLVTGQAHDETAMSVRQAGRRDHPMVIDTTSDTTVVQTRKGLVRGAVVDGIHLFKGIPYAAPPFGADHLRPPRPVEGWLGVRDMLAWGAEPPQPRMPPGAEGAGDLVYDPATPGEDCLNLNIWTPDPTAVGLPVFVWIPGGMFEVCSGASYDGSRFARDGVVCVTITYRVGVEGFLFTSDGVPDRGLLDQLAALAWVRDEIAAFGGDPTNVTVGGESAGAMSVGTLLSMPSAAGRFRRAIMESGAAHRVIDMETARRVACDLAARVGVDVGADDAPSTEAMAAVPWERLLAASMELKGELMADPDPDRWGLDVVASSLPWQPVVDGEVVPARPIDRLAAGAARDIDVMAGSNTDDWRMFRVLGGDIDRVTEEVLRAPVTEQGFLALAAYSLPVEAAITAYRRLAPAARPGELLAELQTDWWCRIPALRLADARVAGPSGGAGTWVYEFSWPSPVLGGAMGACHALEIPFVFDTLDLGPNQMVGGLLGPEPPQQLATEMHAAWVRFATSGDPGWPPYEAVHRTQRRFGLPSTLVDDPYHDRRAIWDGVI